MSSLEKRAIIPKMMSFEFLDTKEKIQQYQLLIGASQWAVSIGGLDIPTAVMTVTSLRAMPCCGQIKHVHCVYRNCHKMKDVVIREHTSEPNYTTLPD
jgi:hypothetical protein